MLEPISDPAVLAELVALDAAVDAHAALVEAARAALTAARGRRAALDDAIVEHARARADDGPSLADELSTAIAADPASASSASLLERLRESRSAASGAAADWEALALVLEQAAEKADDQVASDAVMLNLAQRDHEAAWSEFANAAREAMVDEFERRFEVLLHKVMLPLDALQNAKRLYGSGPVHGGPRKALSSDSLILLRWPREDAADSTAFAWRRLYPPKEPAHDASIDAFRASLVSVAPATVLREKRRAA